jgi:hypothetical protein
LQNDEIDRSDEPPDLVGDLVARRQLSLVFLFELEYGVDVFDTARRRI